MGDPLASEKEFLRANLDDLAAAHPGKYLVIQGERVYAACETYEQGVSEGLRLLSGKGPFLVRSVLHPEDAEAPRIPALAIGLPFRADS